MGKTQKKVFPAMRAYVLALEDQETVDRQPDENECSTISNRIHAHEATPRHLASPPPSVRGAELGVPPSRLVAVLVLAARAAPVRHARHGPSPRRLAASRNLRTDAHAHSHSSRHGYRGWFRRTSQVAQSVKPTMIPVCQHHIPGQGCLQHMTVGIPRDVWLPVGLP